MNQVAFTHTTTGVPVALSGATSTFNFDGHEIRVGGTPDAPLFVTEDLCTALSIASHRDALSKLDADERASVKVDTLGGSQVVSAVTESGMYVLILRARGATTPGTASYRFKRWVTAEVLPAIRRTGGYGRAFAFDANDPSMLQQVLLGCTQALLVEKAKVAELGQALVVTEERAELAEAVAEASAPKAAFFDAFVEADGHYGLHNAARAVGAPPQGFVDWLKRGFLFYQDRELMPKATFVTIGVFAVRVRIVDGKARSRTVVTPRGLQYLGKAWQRHLLKTGKRPKTLFDDAA